MNKKFDVKVGRAEQIPSLLVVTASLRDTGWAGGDSLCCQIIILINWTHSVPGPSVLPTVSSEMWSLFYQISCCEHCS